MAPASQELQLRRAGVPRDHIYRDVGASGSTGTQERRGWHRLNGRLAGRDTLVVVAIDRIGRRWPDAIRSICELRDLGVKIRSLAETGVGIIGMDSPIYKINEQENAVTISGNGFGFREVSRYLDRDRYQLPELAKPQTSDGDTVYLVARTLVRGQGKTEGYHEREIPLRSRMTSMLRNQNGRITLAAEAKERVEYVREVSSILRHAVKTYLQNGVSTGQIRNEHQKIINDCGRCMQQTVEADFWERLQDGIESDDQNLERAEWVHWSLVPQASALLESIQKTGLCHTRDRFRAIAESSDLFGRRIRASKKLPELYRDERSSQ